MPTPFQVLALAEEEDPQPQTLHLVPTAGGLKVAIGSPVAGGGGGFWRLVERMCPFLVKS